MQTELLGQSAPIRKLLEQIKIVAQAGAHVLIIGEPGTGKSAVARSIHEMGGDQARSLIGLRCASIRNEDFEQPMRSGTSFLEEISELTAELQQKLLRAFETGKLTGRIIATSTRNLATESRAGRFSEGLHCWLSVFQIETPPLRDRIDDIPVLAEHFVAQAASRAALRPFRLSKAHVEELQRYPWPGNTWELQVVVERAVILSHKTGRLEFNLPCSASEPAGSIQSFRQQERELILATLQQANGRIHGPDGAAARLGMRPTTLSSRLKRYGIERARRHRKVPRSTTPITEPDEEIMLD